MTAIAHPPPNSIVIRNVRWETFEALLNDRGNDGPRIFYDEGTIEIMSPHRKHERLKTILGRLIEAFTEELDIDISSGGSTTLKSRWKEKGAEPDESYHVQHEAAMRGKDEIDLAADPPPDLVLEVNLTTSTVDKLKIYGAFGVPEVWSYEENSGLVVWKLQSGGKYIARKSSQVLPKFPVAAVVRFVEDRTALSETRLLKEFRAWVRGLSRK